MSMDFGYNSGAVPVDTDPDNGDNGNEKVTDLTTGQVSNSGQGDDAADLDNAPADNNNNTDPNNNEGEDPNNKKDSDNDDAKDGLVAGTSIEVGDKVYTVDANGNLIDENNQLFKEAKDVKAWLAEFDEVNDDANDEINLATIQNLLGVQVTDENDKPIEFDNNPEGVKAYLDAVLESKREEHYETAINTLYQKYPFIEDMINYYVTNGKSLQGFNQVPDRSNIQINDDDEAQHEAIIRMAWQERKQKGDVEHYLSYLKSSGTLLAVAREELEDLQAADKAYKAKLEAEAQRIEQEEIKELEAYWNNVHDTIKNRQIAGYQIPETIVINRNGKKISATPEDFYKYLYLVDKDGKSAYVKDLEKETAESRRDDELLRAYLKFTGGNYSNLVDMAVNKQQVAKLKFKAKTRNASQVRINRPKVAPNNGGNIDFGY